MMKTAMIPSFDEMLKSTPEPYPYQKSFDESRNEPVVVLHSSGSTGLPKPITMTHGSFAVLDNEHNLPVVPGRRKRDWSMWTFEGEARVYTVFPFFHLAGFLSLTLQTIFMNASPVLGPPHLIPDATLLKNVTHHQKLRSIFLPPAVIEQVLHEPNGIDFFKDLDFLVYSGAPFSPAIGDQLSKVVEIISPFGSTEVYPQPELAPSREDWAYHEFNPYVKSRMEPYDPTEGTFELAILVDEDTKDTAATYHNLPGVSEYHTKDLFVQHPEKPQLYRYYGRKDDIIVLANGEKFNPIPLEVSVQNHPSIKGAYVIGTGRRQAALLVEPKEPLGSSGRRRLLKELWPLVEESNKLVPGQGRIQKRRVLCGIPEKPFTRTGKGTIVRKLTTEAYAEEIEHLYHDKCQGPWLSIHSVTNTSDNKSPQVRGETIELQPTITYKLTSVENFVRSVLKPSYSYGTKIGADDDFVMLGIDSEEIVEIVFTLKQNIQKRTQRSVDWISPRTIFRNSSIDSLTQVLYKFLNDDIIPEEDLNLIRTRAVEEAVAKYSEDLPTKSASSAEVQKVKGVSTVAAIGSTGYLGRYLLATLLKDPTITQVFCLDRSKNARAKQEAALLELDADLNSLLSKLTFIATNLNEDRLGLSSEDFDKIANEVDVVVLNAWESNFALPIRYFNPFLQATREVIRLAASGSRQTRVVFVSSLGAVGDMAQTTTAPESLVKDPLAAFNNGYAQSKLAAEMILAAGHEKSGIPVSVARVTQIGGPTQAYAGGKWADQGWISAIVKTSKIKETIPSDGPLLDWLPVDTVAEMIHKFVVNEDAHDGLRFYNVSHPAPESWDLFANVLRESLGFESTVPLQEWVKKLRELRDAGASDVYELSALPLLDFYEEHGAKGPSAYATELALRDSKISIPPLDKQTLKRWLDSWDL